MDYEEKYPYDITPIIDASGAGVEPGGLRSIFDIKLMICYLLHSVNQPVSREHLAEILQQYGIANYFEVIDAAGKLIENGNLKLLEDGTCQVTENGIMVANTLEKSLPYTQRKKAVAAALKFLGALRIQRENKVDIRRAELGGYYVTCRCLEGEGEMMSVTLRVSDTLQADAVRRVFLRNPALTYAGVFALLTGDVHPILESAAKEADERAALGIEENDDEDLILL